MGAHAGGARTLARIVTDGGRPLPIVVGVAKGLEPDTLVRMSEVMRRRSATNGSSRSEVPVWLPRWPRSSRAVVFASADQQSAEVAAAAFRTSTYHVTISDDLPGVEYSMVAKNVAAIGLGVLDGLGKGVGFEYRNAEVSALHLQACAEPSSSWWRWGKEGDRDRARGHGRRPGDHARRAQPAVRGAARGGHPPGRRAGGPDREGDDRRGVASSLQVAKLVEGKGLALPFLEQVHKIVFEGAPAARVLDCLKG